MNGHKTIPEDLPDNAGPGRCRYCLCWSTEDWAKPCPIVDNVQRSRIDAAYGSYDPKFTAALNEAVLQGRKEAAGKEPNVAKMRERAWRGR